MQKELVASDIHYLEKYLPAEKLEEGIDRLKKGEPVQYIVGNVNFFGFLFHVNPSVLIPRFETEELVEKTIAYIWQEFSGTIQIADIGTGSGCIAITLQKKLNNVLVDATDISSEALKVAEQNAIENKAQVHFYEGNLLEPLLGKYDVLISNPPYIAPSEDIMDVVKNNEPHLALYADKEGLYYYEEMLKTAKEKLNPHSMIAFEIGETQGQKIKEMAGTYFPKALVSVEKDMQGRDRFAFIISRENNL